MTRQAFLNQLKSLHNIAGYQLPELEPWEWPEFRVDPINYFIRASDEQQDAIWREITKKQAVFGEPAHDGERL